MDFDIVGRITHPETIAVGNGIREIARLRKFYGAGRWRKRKDIATVRLSDGTIKYTGTRHLVLAGKNSRSNAFWSNKYEQDTIF